ncbi:GTPase [Caviibacter abscessus]|uniref:GTPase n=1 Tax=Caviibacter abscessus TaxID=1766719 RepID=UPI00082A76B5|nr:GTPase [Caviibacter abscessus]
MIQKYCTGCALLLQTENENELGYIPLEKYLTGSQLICKRCFRLKNYGEKPSDNENKSEYIKIVKEAVKQSDIVMPIFDVIDLESSFTTEILDILEDKKSYIILNKLDLLPDYFTATEIARWFKNRLVDENIFAQDMSFISAKSKFGIKGILKKIKNMAEDKKNIKVAVIGVSNVGKSSVLNLLLDKPKITTSKYSGTTKGSIKNSVMFKNTKVTFIDTPGLIPDGRISDLLPDKAGVKLVPNSSIPRKTFTLQEGQVFMLSSLMYFKVNKKCTIQVFTSKNIQFHVTNENKCKELMENGYFKLLTLEQENEYLKNEFETKNIIVDYGYDLCISGLGFIEIKKGPLDITVYKPTYVTIKIRESISKIKKVTYEEEEIW